MTSGEDTAPPVPAPPPVSIGTILEAAFVDPNYPWPLSHEEDGVTAVLTEPEIDKKPPKKKKKSKKGKTTKKQKGRKLSFRRKHEDEISLFDKEQNAAEVTLENFSRFTEEELQEKNYWNVIPEGVVVYRLDTSNRKLQLISSPPPNTDFNLLVREMVVEKATGSHDASRRGIDLVGDDGKRATIFACNQRTATVWLEAMAMMYKPVNPAGSDILTASLFYTGMLKDEDKTPEALENKEKEYLSMAAFSNNLIREGAIEQASERSVGDVYSDIHAKHEPSANCKSLKTKDIIKERAIIKDSWDFYRVVCGLIRDRIKYNEAFRRIQNDPVYPYLNSLTGLNDPGDDGYENVDKAISQEDVLEYKFLNSKSIAEALTAKAEETCPELLEITRSLASPVGANQVALGPVKTVQAAIRKAERKYDGDLLKVTDYCGALMVVDDLSSLLAVLEFARDKYGDDIRRIKLTSLKANHRALPGGYRDCKINLELNGLICEIQVHLKPMWDICGVNGYKHYRQSVEYSTDTFTDPFNALKGMDSKKTAELLLISEEAVVDTPLENLKWQQEEKILDYFAQVGVFIEHGLHEWAEVTLKKLVDLRIESPEIGREHNTTLLLYKYLEVELAAQEKTAEAKACAKCIRHIENRLGLENKNAIQKGWDSVMSGEGPGITQVDIDSWGKWLVDPSHGEREAQENTKQEISTSRNAWRSIRPERFPFLLPPESTSVAVSHTSMGSFLKRIRSKDRSPKPTVEEENEGKKRRKTPIVLQDIEIEEGVIEVREKTLPRTFRNWLKTFRRSSGVPKVHDATEKKKRKEKYEETPSLCLEKPIPLVPQRMSEKKQRKIAQMERSVGSEEPPSLSLGMGFDDETVESLDIVPPRHVAMAL